MDLYSVVADAVQFLGSPKKANDPTAPSVRTATPRATSPAVGAYRRRKAD